MALVQNLIDFRSIGWSSALQLIASVFFVFVIHKFAVLLVKKRASKQNFKLFPGPQAHWLFGHVLEFKQDGTDFDRLLEFIRQFPVAFTVQFGPFLYILNIHHPDYVKTVLGSTEPKDDFSYEFLQSWIGNGLLVSKGEKWFRHRRLLTPAFHYDVLKPYIGLMSDSANIMLDKWETHAKTNEPFELFQDVSLMALDTIMKCAFSQNSHCQTQSGTNPYIQSVYELAYLINLRFRTFPYHSDFIFNLSPHGFQYRKACRIAHNHTEEVIRKRKEELKEEKELDRIQAKRYLDFLDIVLLARDENNQGMSDKDLRAEVDTFMFEGHDTTTSALSFIFYSLACYPEHQKRCRDEVMQALNGKDTFEWEDLNKIPYTTMCIKESLRLYPPVPAVGRQLAKPMTFIDGRTLSAGCRVGTSVFGLHRNPTVWENPEVFDPLRFLPENVSKRSPHAYVPFSAGPRNCIGQNFAMNELKVVTALTLQRYKLIEEPSMKPKLISRLVLRSINGIHIKIQPV